MEFYSFCKKYFSLDQFQSQLNRICFLWCLLCWSSFFIYSSITNKNILNLWGYKSTIIKGLILSTLGAGAMVLAVHGGLPGQSSTFTYILAALFVVGLGFSLQQTSANPFAISLGDESTGSHRLNLAGGINSFGTAIGPIVVSLALFGTAASANIDLGAMIENQEITLGSVQYLYIFVGILFFSSCIFFLFFKKFTRRKRRPNFSWGKQSNV